jgi:putative PEP-CTERM system TPR-repeat lipoprotein
LELLAQAQIANKDNTGALDTYSKLATVLPKSALVQVRLAGVHLLMKDERKAMEDLKRAVALQPDFILGRIAQIELAMRMGKSEEALTMAREVQKLNEKAPSGYSLEGDMQKALNRPALALRAYEKAFSIAKSPQVMIKIADTLKLTGKTKEAEARLAQWRQANPSDPYVPMYVAESYMVSKQFKPAAETLRAVLKVNPNHPVALNNLAWTYQQDKDPRALETAERALAVSPASPEIMDTLGWLLVEQGNTARALPLLQKAVGLSPQALELRYHLAVALNKSGDKLGARKELETLLADNRPFPQLDEARSLLKIL